MKSRKLRIADISYGHSPDKRGERTDQWGREPIWVKRLGSRYRVHDGNDRLFYAIQRGDTHIEARVLGEDNVEQPDNPKLRIRLGFGMYWE